MPHDQLVWEPGGTEAHTSAGSARRYRKPLLSFRWCDIKALLGDTIGEWNEHNAQRMGASLAFYTALSLAPLLVIAIAVAGFVFGEDAARGQVVWQIRDLVGKSSAEAIQQMLLSARKPMRSVPATVLGILALFFGASSVVAELRGTLNAIWDVPTPVVAGARRILRLIREQFFSFAMVLGVGFLLLVSLVLNAWLAAVGGVLVGSLSIPEIITQTANSILSFLVTIALFALIYKVIPDLDLEYRDVLLGAAVTALLFTLGRVLIGIYLGKAGVASTYGAAGSLVLVLFWVYYSAQVFFLGAAFTRVFAERYGSKPRVRHQQPLVDQTGVPVTRPPSPATVITPETDAPAPKT